jgi:hypothetical protein
MLIIPAFDASADDGGLRLVEPVNGWGKERREQNESILDVTL